MDKLTSAGSATVIYYSKPKSSGWLLFCLLLAGGTVYYFQSEQVLSAGWNFLLICGILLFFNICRHLLRLANNQPQLTLTDQGIRRGAAPIDLWESIQEEAVHAVRRGRGQEQVLYYKVGSKSHKLRLGPLAISASQLRQLLLHYRTCFQQQAIAKAVIKYNL